MEIQPQPQSLERRTIDLFSTADYTHDLHFDKGSVFLNVWLTFVPKHRLSEQNFRHGQPTSWGEKVQSMITTDDDLECTTTCTE